MAPNGCYAPNINNTSPIHRRFCKLQTREHHCYYQYYHGTCYFVPGTRVAVLWKRQKTLWYRSCIAHAHHRATQRTSSTTTPDSTVVEPIPVVAV
eukprot:302642-Rhodomonas_salina.1